MGFLPSIIASLLMLCLAASAQDGLRFLQKRVADDPDDYIAQTQFGLRCLDELRDSGRMEWLTRAAAAEKAAFKGITHEQNPGGVYLKGKVALAGHRFADALAAAKLYRELQPEKPAGLRLLFDAHFELGEYDDAATTLAVIEKTRSSPVDAASRRMRLAWIHGNIAEAAKAADECLAAANALSPPQPKILAWCAVQRGELAFRAGDFIKADEHYGAALAAVPNDWSAMEHRAELRAAQERYDEALKLLDDVIAATKRPELMQAAGDVAKMAKREEEAEKWYAQALAGYTATDSNGGTLYRHHLAGFYCDAKPDFPAALALAKADVEERKSIAAFDALAWALYYESKLPEARAAAEKALATGTADSHILRHAGLIFISSGELARGRELMKKSAEANPRQQTFHFHR